MRVLVACEFSQIVTKAFRLKGHEAFSCDILPTEGNPEWHYQGDVFDIINDNWDLMIAHPPCTYLSYAGIAHWNKLGRKEKRDKAMEFFMALYNSKIPKICIENPKGEPMTVFRKPDQIIQPYYFGDPHIKTTCLWLKNLKPLQYVLEKNLFFEVTSCGKPNPIYIDKKGKKRYFTDAISGFKKDAQKLRSKTFQGIADAMADQWG